MKRSRKKLGEVPPIRLYDKILCEFRRTGDDNAALAAKLGVAEATVKGQMSKALQEANVCNRSQLLLYLLRDEDKQSPLLRRYSDVLEALNVIDTQHTEMRRALIKLEIELSSLVTQALEFCVVSEQNTEAEDTHDGKE